MRKLRQPLAAGSARSRSPAPAFAGEAGPQDERAHFAGAAGDAAAATARYIAQMAGEMAALARSVDLDMLTYLLDMAQAEAELIARTPPGG